MTCLSIMYEDWTAESKKCNPTITVHLQCSEFSIKEFRMGETVEENMRIETKHFLSFERNIMENSVFVITLTASDIFQECYTAFLDRNFVAIPYA